MFFIYNCNGDLVGNPAGYATFRGADRQSKIGKVRDALWAAFYDRADKSIRTVITIRQP